MNIGYHVSISGGLMNVTNQVTLEKLSTIQIFPGNPRNYFPSNHTNENIQSIKKLKIPIFVHINYFVNLASDKPVLPKSLSENLNFCDAINASGLIIHMGSNKNKEEGIKNTLYNLKRGYQKTGSKTKILIENTAEGGNRLKFNDIIEFLDDYKYLNLGMCFDTAHSYAAGYDVIKMIEKYHKYIDLIHLNNPNPEVEFGKHLDRHNISLFDKNGKFNRIYIDKIVNLAELYNIPIILETGKMSNDVILCEKYYGLLLKNDT